MRIKQLDEVLVRVDALPPEKQLECAKVLEVMVSTEVGSWDDMDALQGRMRKLWEVLSDAVDEAEKRKAASVWDG